MATIIQPSAAFTTGFNQSATTYDGANEALDISSVLDTLKATDVPLLSLIGRDSLQTPCTQIKHEWLEDEIRGLSATTTDADLNNTSTGTVTLTLVTAGDYLKFRGAAVATGPCDVVRIYSTAGSEIAPVLATANNTIDVNRGYFGNTPIDHTGYTKNIEIIGTFQPQGKTSVGTQRITIKAPLYNYTQIFEDVYAANATQRATTKYVKQNESAYQMGLIAENMGRLFERTLIHGRRQAPGAPTAAGGTMNGIYAFLSTNVYAKAGAILQETFIRDALVALWQNGAGGDDLYAFVNQAQMIRAGQLLDPYRQAGYSDRVFGTWVKRFETPFGAVNFMLDRHMPDTDILILDKSRVGFGPLQGRALGMSPITQTSRESQTWQWTGEYTAELRQEKAHALISGLATTGF